MPTRPHFCYYYAHAVQIDEQAAGASPAWIDVEARAARGRRPGPTISLERPGRRH